MDGSKFKDRPDDGMYEEEDEDEEGMDDYEYERKSNNNFEQNCNGDINVTCG